MNRASLALVLLLGTVAATLVAAGVARDLDRAGPRTSEPGIVDVDRHSTWISPRALKTAWEVIPCSLSLTRPIPPSVAELSPLAPCGLPRGWESWTKHLVAVPPMDLVPLKHVEKTCRIVDRRQLVRLLARHNPGDTARIDALIRANDGVSEDGEAVEIPYGHVSIGGLAAKLAHRGTGDGPSFAWTGALHYGSDRRRMLAPVDPAAALCRQVATPLPGEKSLLWSDDCRALIAVTTERAQSTVEGLIRGLNRIAAIAKLAGWAHGRLNEALGTVARHVKREAWLATMPPSPEAVPVQNAQRQRVGTAKE